MIGVSRDDRIGAAAEQSRFDAQHVTSRPHVLQRNLLRERNARRSSRLPIAPASDSRDENAAIPIFADEGGRHLDAPRVA